MYLLSSRTYIFRKAATPLLPLLARAAQQAPRAHSRSRSSFRSFSRQTKANFPRRLTGAGVGTGAGPITLKAPGPPGPEDCCGSGCQECVWDVYEADLQAFHAAERDFDAPFVSRLLAEWESPTASSGQRNAVVVGAEDFARADGSTEDAAALEVLKRLPVLLGQATPQTMENISRGLIVRSHELRKPHPDHDPQRFLRDICIQVGATRCKHDCDNAID